MTSEMTLIVARNHDEGFTPGAASTITFPWAARRASPAGRGERRKRADGLQE